MQLMQGPEGASAERIVHHIPDQTKAGHAATNDGERNSPPAGELP
jgi:hypothetical protein